MMILRFVNGLRRLHITGVVWLFLAAFAQAQETVVDTPDTLIVESFVDQERVMIGDPVSYTVTVISPSGVSVAWPEPQSKLGSFDVLTFKHDGPYAGDSSTYSDTLRFTLTVYTVGVQTIPPLVLPYTSKDGTTRSAVTDSMALTVVSVIDDEATDIRDLKNPADIPETIPWYIWAGGAALLLVIIAGFIYWYRRRTKEEEEEEIILAPSRLPHEIAFDELDQLSRFQWLNQGRVTQHYTVLSEVLRRYLSARYQINAMEITTTELITSLDKEQIDEAYKQSIFEFLQACDLVKFAKYVPDTDDQTNAIDRARDIISATKSLPEPVAESTTSTVSSPTSA